MGVGVFNERGTPGINALFTNFTVSQPTSIAPVPRRLSESLHQDLGFSFLSVQCLVFSVSC